jgi:hypothetical protein
LNTEKAGNGTEEARIGKRAVTTFQKIVQPPFFIRTVSVQSSGPFGVQKQ